MQRKFEKMTNQELRAYALAHREDLEALDVLYSRRTPDSEAIWFHPPKTKDEERSQFELFKHMIEERAGKTDNNHPITTTVTQKENNPMTSEKIITSEQISQYRSELAGNPDALAALDVIEKEYGGKLAEAAKAIAIRNDIEGIADFGLSDWFDAMLQECRDFICQPKYQNLRENYLPALIPPLTDCVAGSLGCPPGIAAIIAVPFAAYIKEEGMEKFCQSPNS
jgi:hypothetical protein